MSVVPLKRHDFREGDCVRLRSGGPLMICAIADAEIMTEVQCIWVDRRRLKTGSFDARTLHLVARMARP